MSNRFDINKKKISCQEKNGQRISTGKIMSNCKIFELIFMWGYTVMMDVARTQTERMSLILNVTATFFCFTICSHLEKKKIYSRPQVFIDLPPKGIQI